MSKDRNRIILTKGFQSNILIEREIKYAEEDDYEYSNEPVVIFKGDNCYDVINFLSPRNICDDEYYECIRGEEARLFFDYDGPTNIRYNIYDILAALKESITITLNSNFSLVENNHAIKKEYIKNYIERIAVLKNITKTKTSYHIIFPQIFMKISNMKSFVEQMKNIQQYLDILSYIDIQVYKTNTTLRTIHSSKKGDNSKRLEPLPMKDYITHAMDYFISPIVRCNDYTNKFVEITKINNEDNIITFLDNIFGEGVVINTDEVKSFAYTEYTGCNLVLKLKRVECNLCGEIHKNTFYLRKSSTETGTVIELKKNGKCHGLNSNNNKIVIKRTEVLKDELYDLALKIANDGNIRKTPDGLFIWDSKWNESKKQELGNIVVRYMNENLSSLQPVAIAAIKNSKTRKDICDNIYDIIPSVEFSEVPQDYLMFKNGLFNIFTGEKHPNPKEFNVVNMMDANYTSEVDNYDEFIEVLYKIIYPKSNVKLMMLDRDVCFNRFKQAFSTLLTGISDTEIYHFWGKANGGKSFLLDLLLSCFGSYGYKGKLNILRSKNTSTDEVYADYKGKLLTVISELEQDFIIEERCLKMITENSVTADRKYVSQNTFKLKARTIIDSNYCLEINSSDKSIEKRIQTFTFSSEFSDAAKEDDYENRIFVPDRTLRDKVNAKYFNDAMVKFLVECTKQRKGINNTGITPQDKSSMGDNIRAAELQLLINKKMTSIDTFYFTWQSLLNNDRKYLTMYCPELLRIMQDPKKFNTNSYIQIAVNKCKERRNIEVSNEDTAIDNIQDNNLSNTTSSATTSSATASSVNIQIGNRFERQV